MISQFTFIKFSLPCPNEEVSLLGTREYKRSSLRVQELMVPGPVLQELLWEVVFPIQLFVALIQQSSPISMLSLAICYPTPLSAKIKLNTSSEIQPLWGLEEFLSQGCCIMTSVWKTSMKFKKVLHVLQVSFFACPRTRNYLIMSFALSPGMLWSPCFVRTGHKISNI